MKITNKRLKQIIKEELGKILNETGPMGLSYEDELAHISQSTVSDDYRDEIHNIDKATQENHDAGQVQYLLDHGFTMQQIQILDELNIINVETATNKDYNIRSWTR
jgi:hypothetical protein